ncbi:hypothetical protein MCOR31_011876 [Pyricularia oryzae]|nr:hypothetical protein MCOR01_006730 [Pyricularia oryzae]KAI6287388.1 hypothetical protein MCOR26_000640 [Pyricularia oryzae]KAI6336320.1 hypothetical protein MCOR30_003599 [Pyricularia oryzae]KAI6349885.1 hypothetical protein MCOR28_000666 [Pyricularia oryzae]KAI6352477.1 hypothetical protein MCOR31_011876 [Pyricularia oryzae]
MVPSTLAVKGAILAYSCLGSGPLLVTVPGANGDAAIFDLAVPHLANNFTVCSYDRRGYSRSVYTEPNDLTMPVRLQTDADDVAALIDHLSPGEPALVFGTSSGAIVSLDLLSRHPEAVSFLVAHEPPLTRSLGEAGAQIQAVFQSAEDTFFSEGIHAAVQVFLGPVVASDPESVAAHDALDSPARASNAALFFAHEINHYTAYSVDTPALQASRDKLVFDNGDDSTPPATTMTDNLAQSVGVAVEHTPGGHLGYVSKPVEFAAALAEIFAAHGKL